MNFSIKTAALGLLAAIGISACSGGSGAEVTYLPVKTEKNSHWGMVGPDGKILFDDEFENEPSIVLDGVFTVRESKGVSVYLAEKKPTLIGDLENLKSAGCMSEGVIPVTRNGERITYYDKKGKIAFVLEPYKGKELIIVAPYFSDGLAVVVNEDYHYGAINSDGKVVVEPKYASLTSFSEGFAVATPVVDEETEPDSDEDAVTFIINRKGEEVAKLRGVNIYSRMINGLFAGSKGERYGFFNKKGEFKKMPEKVKGIDMFNKKYFIFRTEDGNYGVMNMEGEQVIRPRYESISFISDDKFLCESDNDKYYIVDTNDERLFTFDDVKGLMCVREMICLGYGLQTKFNIIGGDSHEVTFFKEDGEQMFNNDFYEIGFDMPSSVESDYFNATGAAERLASYVTDNGFDKVVVGSLLYKYVTGNPSEYTRSDKYYFPDLEGGYRYNISGYAYTNKYIAKSTPVYTTQYYWGYSYQSFDHYSYSWDTSAMVDKIHVELNTAAAGQFTNIKRALVAAIKAKGYAVTADEAAYSVLSKGNVRIFLSPMSSYDSGSLQLNMYTVAGWNNTSASSISNAKDAYNSIAADQVSGSRSSSSSNDDDEEVVVEEVVETADSTGVPVVHADTIG